MTLHRKCAEAVEAVLRDEGYAGCRAKANLIVSAGECEAIEQDAKELEANGIAHTQPNGIVQDVSTTPLL